MPLTHVDMRSLVAAADADRDNIAAARSHALAAAPPMAAALGDMVCVLWLDHEVTGRLHAGIALLRPALAALEPRAAQDPAAAWALSRLRHGLSRLLHRLGAEQPGGRMRLPRIVGDLETAVCRLHVVHCDPVFEGPPRPPHCKGG